VVVGLIETRARLLFYRRVRVRQIGNRKFTRLSPPGQSSIKVGGV